MAIAPDVLTAALTERKECLHTVYAWQCWCPTCAANIVAEYLRDGPLPTSIVRKTQTAIKGLEAIEP